MCRIFNFFSRKYYFPGDKRTNNKQHGFKLRSEFQIERKKTRRLGVQNVDSRVFFIIFKFILVIRTQFEGQHVNFSFLCDFRRKTREFTYVYAILYTTWLKIYIILPSVFVYVNSYRQFFFFRSFFFTHSKQQYDPFGNLKLCTSLQFYRSRDLLEGRSTRKLKVYRRK